MGYELADDLLKDFIPANERSWYPFEWPSDEWQIETQKNDPKAYNKKMDEIRKLAEEDFFFFCDVIMHDPLNPDHVPLCVGVHDELCHILQYGEDDTLALIPRKHLKSTIATVGYALWRLGKNPNLRILIYTDVLKPTGHGFMRAIQGHILHNSRLHLVFPDLKPAKDRGSNKFQKWNNTEMIVERTHFSLKENSITISSTEQDFTSWHGELQLYDDIVTYKNAKTDEKLKGIYTWYEKTLCLADRINRKVIVGTRYHDADTYGQLIKNDAMKVYLRKYREKGKYIWDDELNIKYCEKMHKQLRPYEFSCQFMNDPIEEGTAEFQPGWIKQRWNYDLIIKNINTGTTDSDRAFEDWIATHNRYLGMDPNRAQKKIKRNDFATILAVGVDTLKNIYVYEFYRDKPTGSLEQVNLYCDWMEKYNPIYSGLEVFGGDAHLLEPMREEMKVRGIPTHRLVEFDVKSNESQEDRVRAIQIYFQLHKVWLGEGDEWSEFELELLRFPYGAHNDLIINLANIITQLVEPPIVRKKSEELEGWRARVCGHKSEVQNWMAV